MPIYNGVEKYTVTNGGGTVNLDVTRQTTVRYVFSGTATLAAGYVIQPTGTPAEGMEFDIRWQSVCTTAGANVVTVFGTVLTTAQALADLIITCYYNGSAWDVDIQEDGIQDIWEVGTGGPTSAKLVNGGTSTAVSTGTINAGIDCANDGSYSLSAGVDNIITNSWSFCVGELNTVAGDYSSCLGGKSNNVLGEYCIAQGDTCTAEAVLTHAGGNYSHTRRRAEFARASGRISSGNVLQYSKLTAFISTTNATPAVLALDGIADIPVIYANSIVYFRGEGIAIQQAGSAGTVGDNASFHFNGCITNIAGTTSLTDTVRWQDNTGAWGASATRTEVAAAATWSMVPTANNGTDTLDITVTGEANKTVYWLCNLEFTEIRYTP